MTSRKLCFEKWRPFIKVFLYLTLFLIYVQFYLIGQTREYLEGKTTFATKFEDDTNPTYPIIVICPNPPFKPSISKQSGYKVLTDLTHDWQERYLKDNMTQWEMYENLTYVLDRDFRLDHSIGFGSLDNLKLGETKLKWWKDKVMSVSQIATSYHGYCILVDHNYDKTMDNGYLKLQINLNNSLEEIPKSLSVFLSDKNTWQSIGEFSILQPKLFSFPFVKNQHNGYTIKATSHLTYYHQGLNNVTSCQTKLLKSANCSKICYPIRFNYIYDLEPCQSIKDTFCMDTFMHANNINCLVPKQVIEYHGESRFDSGSDQNKTSLQIGVTFEVAKKEVKEEVYVLSTKEYIGSIGGSLGLFLGFSFYTFATDVLGLIVNRF